MSLCAWWLSLVLKAKPQSEQDLGRPPSGAVLGANTLYRSLAGDVHEAKIVARRPDGTVDLHVRCGSGSENFMILTRIQIGDGPGCCFG